MSLDETPCADFLLEEKRYKVSFQPSDDLASILRDTLLNREEEIIDTFLSSLKLDHSFNDDSGIHSN